MTGAEITQELERRKGHRPSPGTIYPVLKDLANKNFLNVDDDKKYSLSEKGKQELDKNLNFFFDTFCDIEEMRTHCQCHRHNNI